MTTSHTRPPPRHDDPGRRGLTRRGPARRLARRRPRGHGHCRGRGGRRKVEYVGVIARQAAVAPWAVARAFAPSGGGGSGVWEGAICDKGVVRSMIQLGKRVVRLIRRTQPGPMCFRRIDQPGRNRVRRNAQCRCDHDSAESVPGGDTSPRNGPSGHGFGRMIVPSALCAETYQARRQNSRRPIVGAGAH